MPETILRLIRPVSPAAGAFALGKALRGRARLGLLLFVLLATVLLVRGGAVSSAGSPSEALAAHLFKKGLNADPDAMAWLAPPAGPLALRPVVFLANRSGDLRDVYYADVRATDDGRVLGLWFLTNITRTSSADEALLAQVPGAVAYAARLGEQFDAIVRLDVAGEAQSVTAGWSGAARLQNKLSNLQETGRAAGFGRVRYHFKSAIDALQLSADASEFTAVADGSPLRLDAHDIAPLEGAERVKVSPQVKGKPGTITWLVDTVRNISWVGSGPVEWLEHQVFSLTDRANRTYHDVVGTDVEAEVREALPMATSTLAAEQRALLTVTDPELGWPPAPLQPTLEPVVRGEGQWLPLVDDPFVNANPNAPPAFYQTFLRVDPVRDFTRVYITLWDPRQVQLHIAMGTREPESATGETGTGMIPRDPELLGKLVGGFNGGFQALHGEFGMMSESRVYLPPKPWAATVAVYEDGRVGMGSWPGPDRRREWDEESANEQIPADMVAMRQNLTSMVEDGEYNPWQRWWWGAAPVWGEEQTYIPRSGLCLTSEGFMAYLWGESMGPEELGKAMLALRCVRGMHLDMNGKHTGFEFYKPYAANQAMPALERPLSDAEFEGTGPSMQGFRFRARKAVTTMSPLRFPRYLERDPRDFFFLTLKDVLPGPDLTLPDQQVAFSSAGLPHAGWPHAFARAELRAASGAGPGVWLVRIDPARARPMLPAVAEPAGATAGQAASVPAIVPASLATLGPVAGERAVPSPPSSQAEELALYAMPHRLQLRYAVGAAPQRAQVLLRGAPLTEASLAPRAAIGVDGHGFLLYAEAAPGQEAELLRRLRQAGVAQALALPRAWRLGFGVGENVVAVDGVTPLRAAPGSEGRSEGLGFVPPSHAAAEVIYPDNAPMPYRRWGGLQDQRVRYFPKGEPRFKAPTNAL